jgi:hypothetical protein
MQPRLTPHLVCRSLGSSYFQVWFWRRKKRERKEEKLKTIPESR